MRRPSEPLACRVIDDDLQPAGLDSVKALFESESRMFAQMRSRFGLAIVSTLLMGGALFALDPLRGSYGCDGCRSSYNVCGGRCQSKYRPPSVQPSTIFGYQPTTWSPWPGSTFGVTRGWENQPPLAPNGTDIESLPSPRTSQKWPTTQSGSTPLRSAYQYWEQ